MCKGNTMQGLTDEIRSDADYIHEITMEEAKALPNMLGVLCSKMLAITGWYGCIQNGEKHLYVLKAA